jgi:glycosyltransferase involved in cell wall biosynthesis
MQEGSWQEQRGCEKTNVVWTHAEDPEQTGAGLRIAVFSGNYNCVRDGANRALNRLVRFLIQRGAGVRVYSPTVSFPPFEAEGDVVSVPSLSIPTRPEYRIAAPLTRAGRQDVLRFGPTHFHLSAPDLLGTSAQAFAKQLRVPVVISHHTQFESYLAYYGLTFLRGWLRRRIQYFYSQADYVLAPNGLIAELFRAELSSDKVGVWARGVDRHIFCPARRDLEWRRSLGYADEELIVLFFGRIVIEKGLEVFARTVDQLRRRGHAITPLVVGDGPALDWFRTRLGECRTTGHLEDTDLGRAVASSDVLLNPSETEAFGNVNLEAMASGLSIVSADVSSAQALLRQNVSGLLVPPGDSDAFANAAERLLCSADERRRLAQAALKASAAYNWDEVMSDVLHAYRRVQRI